MPTLSPMLWATALRTPLLTTHAQGRNAQQAVKLNDGVQNVFEKLFVWIIYRVLIQMIYTVCTFQLRSLAMLCAQSFGAIVAIAFALVFLGDVPRHGLLARRVRLRFHHPVLEWMVRGEVCDR